MSRENIIRMAREAGFLIDTHERPIDYLEFYKTYIPPPPISSLQEPYEKHHRKYGERWKAAYAQIPLWMKEMSWYSFWRGNT